MSERWEGGPGSGAAERVWVSFLGKCEPKEGCQVQLLLSTLPALPTLARKETGFAQTSQGLSQGWPAPSPPAPPFLSARQKSTSATLITANTLINKAARWIYC